MTRFSGSEVSGALADNEQLNTLRELAAFCLQAGATSQDAQDSIRRAGIRPAHTPAVLITRGTLHGQLAKITNLPRNERTKAFTLLIAMLSIADERRRTHLCAGQCNHAWHHLEHGQLTQGSAAFADLLQTG
ncbi:MAG: DUF5958 family protein [Actinoallomurus sp.]